MTVLLAPDKFKGSLTAAEVAAALSRGIRRSRPGMDVVALPVADGGDGTLDAAVAAGFRRVPIRVSGPTGRPVDTAYARRGATAVVEMADACGLARLPGGRPAPLQASSRGVGEVAAAAVAAGCTRLVVGIGGSASTDGGLGFARALGAVVTSAGGAEPGEGGGALAEVTALEFSGLRLLDGVEVVVACDVDNPLTGEHGAAAVYGPQKGATEADVAVLDAALAQWADVVQAATGRDLRDTPGAGAAGGVGFAAVALLGARLRPGIELMLELLDFDRHVAQADWVVVGEGSLDRQSLRGKAPVGVAARARAAGARVLAVCGRCTADLAELRRLGIEEVHALIDEEPDPHRCMAHAAELLEGLGARLAAGGRFD